MQQTAARTNQRHANTFLTHFFGGGLEGGDREFVVERFRSTYDGEIKPVDDGQGRGGRARQRRTVSLRTVRSLRPAHDEIIIATSVSRDAGIQLYGVTAAGFNLRGRWRSLWSLPPASPSSPASTLRRSPCSTGIETANAHGSGEGIGAAPKNEELPGCVPSADLPRPRLAAPSVSRAWRRAVSPIAPATPRPGPKAVSTARTQKTSGAPRAPGASAATRRGKQRGCASSAVCAGQQRDEADAGRASSEETPPTASSGPASVPLASVARAVSWHPRVASGASTARPPRPIGPRGRPTPGKPTPEGAPGMRVWTALRPRWGPHGVPAAQGTATCAPASIAGFRQARPRSSSSRSRPAQL